MNYSSEKKSVYFDLTMERETISFSGEPGTEVRYTPDSSASKKDQLKKSVGPMQEAIDKLQQLGYGIQRSQRYFMTRENRNLSTGKSLKVYEIVFLIGYSQIYGTSCILVFCV